MTKIVRMTEAHLGEIGQIVEATPLFQQYEFPGAQAEKQLSARLTDAGSRLLTALDSSGRVVGFAWFTLRGAFGRSGYLRLIAVHPDCQAGGIGVQLLKELEREFLSPHGIFLLVTATNPTARKFYEKQGYTLIGALPGYVKAGIDECLYFKPAD
ncbi:MAG: N-acetyltransferase family protein [Bacteriovoracia bacterium]